MKLPMLWLAAAFIAGIAAAGWAPFTNSPAWRSTLPLFTLAAGALLVALALGLRNRLVAAWACALVVWFCIGLLAAPLESLSLPPHHVTALVARGNLETSDPLRWRGRLRYQPLRMPWGVRYEVDLEQVEVAGRPRPVAGGLRLNYYFTGRGVESPPALLAGDRVEALVRARLPRNFLNPGAFDSRSHLARQGVHLLGTLRSFELLQRVEIPPPALNHRLARIRGRLLEQIDTLFVDSPGHAAVLRAMLLGDRNFLDHELADTFRRTAVYHVLVVSGLHVAALAAFLYWVGRRLRLSLVATTVLILIVFLAFVGVVEDRPPIQRAALMATVYLVSRLLFRDVELLNTVAVAALLILLARPASLFDPGFQLSFVAAGMIGALALPWVDLTSTPYRRALAHITDVTRDGSHAPRVAQFRLDLRWAGDWLARRLSPRIAPRAYACLTAPTAAALRLWEIFLVSAAIQLGMLPLMAWYFHRVTPGGPLVNVPGAILAVLMVPVGYLTLAAANVWPWLGALATHILGALTASLLASVGWFNEFRWVSYRTPEPPVWLFIAFFAAIVLLAAASRGHSPIGHRRKLWLAAAPVAVFGLLIAVHPFAPRLERGQLEISVLDVGQGDAIFVAFPDGRTLLTDAGGVFGSAPQRGFRAGFDVGEQVVSSFLWHRGIQRLDAVVLSHAHQDHMDGLHAILQNFRVRELWVGRDVATPAYRALRERAAFLGVPVVPRRRGEHFEWGGVTGIWLWPEDPSEAAAASNNDSLVLRLEHGSLRMLLPGDIERAVERELVSRDDLLEADFLKVPHHGSRTSATREFLGRVSPRVAVLSLGENNPFNHPHREVTSGLAAHNTQVFRTDRHGAVTVLSDGRVLRVRPFVTSPGK